MGQSEEFTAESAKSDRLLAVAPIRLVGLGANKGCSKQILLYRQGPQWLEWKRWFSVGGKDGAIQGHAEERAANNELIWSDVLVKNYHLAPPLGYPLKRPTLAS